MHSSLDEARACTPLAAGGALVGTAGGLVRLDATGGIAQVWTASDGLPGTRIESISEAEPGALWIGTDNGVAKLDASGHKILFTQRGRSIRDVVTFAGTTYLATWSGGVRKLGASGASDSTAVPLAAGKWSGPRAQVSSLAVAGGALYAGTAAGLFQLVDGKFLAAPVRRPDLADSVDAATLAPIAITSLYGDGDTLWIASDDGLYARRPDGEVRSFGGGELRRVTALDGAIAVAGLIEGLQRVERGRLVAFPGAPRQLTVAQALGGRAQALCAGGLDGAWLRGGDETTAWIAAARRQGPPSNDISALAADGDRLWVGTFDRGLAVLERGAWRPLAHPALDARVNALLVERRPSKPSRLWVATANGLSLVSLPETSASASAAAPSTAAASAVQVRRLARDDGMPGRGVLALTLLADGRLLVGTSYGAVLVDARALTDGAALPRPLRLGAKSADGSALGNVWAVAQARDGAVWLGTTTGLYRGSAEAAGAEPWLRFSLASGHLEDDWVTALVVRGDRLYAGTYKGGVVAIDQAIDKAGLSPAVPGSAAAAPSPTPVVAAPPTAAFRSARVRAGWVNPGGLTVDDGALLVATMDGLFASSLGGPAASSSSSSSLALSLSRSSSDGAVPGLPGVDVTAAARLGSVLYVATRRGLAELR